MIENTLIKLGQEYFETNEHRIPKEEEENILIRPMMPRKYTEKQRAELRKFEKELLNDKSRENR